MIKLLNAALTVLVLIAAFKLYSLEYSKRAAQREIAATERAIAEEHENLRMLSAEWSSLQRPERLARLAEQHLDLKIASQLQFTKPADLEMKLPARTAIMKANQADDPVAALIEEFAQ